MKIVLDAEVLLFLSIFFFFRPSDIFHINVEKTLFQSISLLS